MESRLECGMQKVNIHTKPTSSYSSGPSLAYRGLRGPGLGYRLSSFQFSFGSGGGSSSFGSSSSFKAMLGEEDKDPS